jgi:hypothetical protein
MSPVVSVFSVTKDLNVKYLYHQRLSQKIITHVEHEVNIYMLYNKIGGNNLLGQGEGRFAVAR